MSTSSTATPEKIQRKFLPEDLDLDAWESIEPYFTDLLERDPTNIQELKNWLKDRSELDAVLSEDLGWRFIKSTIDTTDKQAAEAYRAFIMEVQPKIAPYENKLNEKLIAHPSLPELEQEEGYDILIREIRKDLDLFCEENIPLIAENQEKAQKFGEITGAMSVTLDGEEVTMQKASTYLKYPDRSKREEAYNKVKARRLQDADKLDDLYSELVRSRHKIAQNAGFANYRDYKFKSLGRFDYTPQDCFDFHESIRTEVKPIIEELHRDRKKQLGVDTLRPWDTAVDPSGKPPLKPFGNERELIDLTANIFRNIRPHFGDCLLTMEKMQHLDLDSKSGKAPGGYNYPLQESGVPFIFMNAVGDHSDLVTMIHEGGHAVHSFLTRDLELSYFKDTPSEVAELASMGMEMMSLDQWHLAYENEEDLDRAKKNQFERALSVLPWIATIDKFQHWVYENPEHTKEERTENWVRIVKEFGSDEVDHSDHEDIMSKGWQKQLHLFEVPFYYIEYGMAQLGALALWKNFKEDPEKTLNEYTNALKLGYKRTIPEIYKEGGIRFDFSKAYVRELVQLVRKGLKEVDSGS